MPQHSVQNSARPMVIVPADRAALDQSRVVVQIIVVCHLVTLNRNAVRCVKLMEIVRVGKVVLDRLQVVTDDRPNHQLIMDIVA